MALDVDARIDRKGSSLTIGWSAGGRGEWSLTDDLGRPCAKGAADLGRNRVAIPKIDAAMGVTFRSGDIVIRAPGRPRVSGLKKMDRAARVYQLPVRTWAARADGYDARGRLVDLDDAAWRSIRELGVDAVWLTGVLEQAAPDVVDPDVVKGEAGSYYAIRDAWDVSPQVGTIADLERVIDQAHRHGLRVLLDFIPNHTARRHVTDVACKSSLDHGVGDDPGVFFSTRNSYYYLPGTTFVPPATTWLSWGALSGAGGDGAYDVDLGMPGIQTESPARVTGNDIAVANPSVDDWYETAKINYGWDFRARRGAYDPRPKSWETMADIGRYWLNKGVDGFRVDFAHSVPLEFWRWWAAELRRVQPNAFLIAEAYESDERMKIPGFTYEGLLAAGFDSVYNSDLYWRARRQFAEPGDMRSALAQWTPLNRGAILESGKWLTHYVENHDELRVASRLMAPRVPTQEERADVGFAWAAWTTLLPGHVLIHGGQEVGEDASTFGPFAGDNGRTSIFDYVHQERLTRWRRGEADGAMVALRDRYRRLLALKAYGPFAAAHSSSYPSWIDLDGANWSKSSSRWVDAYVRFGGGRAYLVVINSDPFQAREATVHMTASRDVDSLGALRALGIPNDARRVLFRETLSHEGWEPKDPAVDGRGIPGWALWRESGIPSGVYLGEIPRATTLVFEISFLR